MLRPHSPSPRTGRGHRPCLRRPAAANGAAANLGVQKAVRVPGHVPVSEAAGSQPSDCVRSTRAKAKMLQRHGGGGGSAGEGPRPAGAFSTPSQNRSRACALPAPPLVLTHTCGPTHTHTHTRELSRVQSHTRTDAHTPTHTATVSFLDTRPRVNRDRKTPGTGTSSAAPSAWAAWAGGRRRTVWRLRERRCRPCRAFAARWLLGSSVTAASTTLAVTGQPAARLTGPHPEEIPDDRGAHAAVLTWKMPTEPGRAPLASFTRGLSPPAPPTLALLMS